MSNYQSTFKCPDCKRPLNCIDDGMEGYYHCDFCKQDYDRDTIEEEA